MPDGDSHIDEDELERMLEEQSKLKEKPKHRGYGDYERRGIYRGPDVKNESKD
ncbi:hypothetical protein [Methanolobus chelungpuianus]|uniref:hypothetical protein n=1 Tax=Methanolobus chelungpuianus TaxID=502115 RepID=UPI0021145B25|nr:hypothetical protein [Methanolobus chelungpuianus]